MSKHRVTIAARHPTRPVIAGGRAVGPTPFTFDADDATMGDIHAARDRLYVTWPKGWVAPDGSTPTDTTPPRAPMRAPKIQWPGDAMLAEINAKATPEAATVPPDSSVPLPVAMVAIQTPASANRPMAIPLPPPPQPRPFGAEPCCSVGRRADYMQVAEDLRHVGQPGRSGLMAVAKKYGIARITLRKHRSACLGYVGSGPGFDLPAAVTWQQIPEPLQRRAIGAIGAIDVPADDTDLAGALESAAEALSMVDVSGDDAYAMAAKKAGLGTPLPGVRKAISTVQPDEEVILAEITALVAHGKWHGWPTQEAVGARHGWDHAKILDRMHRLHSIAVDRVARSRGPRLAQIETHVANVRKVQADEEAVAAQYDAVADEAFARQDWKTAEMARNMASTARGRILQAEKLAAEITLKRANVPRGAQAVAAVQVNVNGATVASQQAAGSGVSPEVLVRILDGICTPGQFAELAPRIDEALDILATNGEPAMAQWLGDQRALLTDGYTVV